MLGMLAGAFIGLGALFNVIVLSDASIPFGARRVLGGVVFSLGLFLVLVAGAELFTGNNLLAMAWADRKVTTFDVLRNWAIVCAANFAGALVLAALVFLSGHTAIERRRGRRDLRAPRRGEDRARRRCTRSSAASCATCWCAPRSGWRSPATA